MAAARCKAYKTYLLVNHAVNVVLLPLLGAAGLRLASVQSSPVAPLPDSLLPPLSAQALKACWAVSPAAHVHVCCVWLVSWGGTIGALLLMLSWTCNEYEETARAAWLGKQPAKRNFVLAETVGDHQLLAGASIVQGKSRSVTSSAARYAHFLTLLCRLKHVM